MKLCNYFVAIVCTLSLYGCSDTDGNKTDPDKDYSFEFDHSKIPHYFAIVDSLDSHGYVPFFRLFERTNFDFGNWNVNSDESVFLRDSVAYYKARETFFNQDKDFLYWLLSFKNDTIQDTTALRRTLWKPFINPYSSTISPCTIITSRSRQAINLVYAFLDGERITCVECRSGDHSCAVPKYEFAEKFLDKRRKLSMNEIRKEWKPDESGTDVN